MLVKIQHHRDAPSRYEQSFLPFPRNQQKRIKLSGGIVTLRAGTDLITHLHLVHVQQDGQSLSHPIPCVLPKQQRLCFPLPPSTLQELSLSWRAVPNILKGVSVKHLQL